jgi:hypothetical protein
MGNSLLDGGISRDPDTWMVTYEEADVLILPIEYVNFLWDKTKTLHASQIV